MLPDSNKTASDKAGAIHIQEVVLTWGEGQLSPNIISLQHGLVHTKLIP